MLHRNILYKLFFAAFWLTCCTHQLRKDQPGVNLAIEEGKKLSLVYCSSCHLYPAPNLLGKETWLSQTLPHMGPQLGIFEHNGIQYPVEKTPGLPENYYPSEQVLSSEKWQKILNYYKKAAPEVLTPAERNTEIISDTLFFKAHTSEYRSGDPPMVTAVNFDPGNQLIYASNAIEGKFLIFDRKLRLVNELDFRSIISHINFTNDINTPGKRNFIFTFIGSLYPSDAASGAIVEGWYNHEDKKAHANLLLDNISRPVETQLADLDQDGKDDLLISEFGHRRGRLFWLKKSGEKNILKHTPGCIQSHIIDYNNNGFLDIIALCTQAEEGIYLFRNKGKGVFEEKTFLRFQSTAGSSSFELHDFNSDGHLDILYTSGDNADYSTVFKPYHGVYIYLNDGNDGFEQTWFYPVNGAYDAKARDFDRDGNLDIAVISFFADYENNPEESFVFFHQRHPPSDGKNEGGFDFVPYHHPAASRGRWLTMDVADWNRNGYDDILLGNFSLGPTPVDSSIQNKWIKGPFILVLENMAQSAK